MTVACDGVEVEAVTAVGAFGTVDEAVKVKSLDVPSPPVLEAKAWKW